jgi:hypothetical protein
MKKCILLITATFIFLQLSAQKSIIDKSASFTTAFGSSNFSASLAYQHLWKPGKKKKFGIGTGVRFTSYFGSNQYFTTAPAKLTSGQTGPGVFFADDIVVNIDSVLLKKAQLNALNVSVNFTYNIYKNHIGF